jgi:hypothetical protein
MQRRRRIDRITAPDYLEGLGERDVAEVREMRDDCRQEEARLSYVRRLQQGQIDIVRAEQARRAGRSTDLLDALPEILGDEDAPARSASMASVYAPDEDGRRRDDSPVSDGALSRLPDLDDEALEDLRVRLEEEERRTSETRRTVLAALDALQGELVSRYRTGDVAVDDIVASVGGAAAPRGDDGDVAPG